MNTPYFPGFEILETMPRGGMSTVYKARQISLDRIVALKALPSSLATEAADLQQFLTEARITANLKHPNIVQVYDFGKTEQGIYYFIMEFISGYSVGDWIRRKKCLSEKNSLLIAQSVAEALSYAWKNAGIVHCDIKPDNIIIDGDGTVKVADLGLAKSVRTMVHDAKSDDGMVFGTPNYISPEQSRGDTDLDCRADIYSLGATLYHAMSGKMPFEGVPALTAMDLQITDHIPDVQDHNPHISSEASLLIEKMLAKDRKLRQADWEAVQADLERVLQRRIPLGELLPAGASTMLQSAHRGMRPRVKASMTFSMPVVSNVPAPDSAKINLIQRQFHLKQARRKKLKTAFGLALAIIILLAGGYLIIQRAKTRDYVKPDPQASRHIIMPQQYDGVDFHSGRGERDEQLHKMMNFAQQWALDNPQKLIEIIQNYRKITQEGRDTAYALQAEAEIDKYQKKIQSVKAEVMAVLEKQTQPLIAKKQYAAAADLYEKYTGNWAPETEPDRTLAAQNLREQEEDYQKEQQAIAAELKRRRQQEMAEAGRRLNNTAHQAAELLLARDFQNAAALARKDLENPAIKPCQEQFEAMAGILMEAAQIEQTILATFRAQIGQEITVPLGSGAEKMIIKSVLKDEVQAEQKIVVGAGSITRPRTIRCGDLTPAERRRRLSQEKSRDVALIQGLLSVLENDLATAATWFKKSETPLAVALLEISNQSLATQTEAAARRDFYALLRNARIDLPQEETDINQCISAILNRKFDKVEADKVARDAAAYAARYERTQWFAQCEPVIVLLSNAGETPPPSLPNSSPPARPETSNNTPRDLREKLGDANPKLQRWTLNLEGDGMGNVIAVSTTQGGIQNISPLAGVNSLRRVKLANCVLLSDLAPLQGMQLQELEINDTMVINLEPLRGMPLVSLNISNTRVTDLAPLQGMALTTLNAENARIRDLTPLQGMPLAKLYLSKNRDLIDLGPLRDNNTLAVLHLADTQIQDISLLKDLKLTELNISGCQKIRDFSGLANMPLTELMMSQCNDRFTNFRFLQKMRLEKLDLSRTDFQDMILIRDMPLQELDLSYTKVRERDLAMLQNMPLHNLNLAGLASVDLELVKHLGLVSLDLRQTKIKNIEVLQDMPVRQLWITFDQSKASATAREIISRMQFLERLNGGWHGVRQHYR